MADVKRNLTSLIKMVDDDNDVWLSKRGSFIVNVKTGKKVNMRIKNGTPEFDIWVKKANETGRYGVLNVNGEADVNDEEESVFHRLERHI